jgi:hypothetical protein
MSFTVTGTPSRAARRGLGGAARPVGVEPHEGVESRVQPLRAKQVGRDDVAGVERAGAIGVEELVDGKEEAGGIHICPIRRFGGLRDARVSTRD